MTFTFSPPADGSRKQTLLILAVSAVIPTAVSWWIPANPPRTIAASDVTPKTEILPKTTSKSIPQPKSKPAPQPKSNLNVFKGGANSIVSRTVGSAEGTRGTAGGKNRAYYGHVDPGNSAWNLGSFSYQHCDASCTPEEADRRQLLRLQSQDAVLQAKAKAKGLTLTVEERLNGIDLANQAPAAALDSGGYIDWLVKAKAKGMTGSNAILWARTYSFLNPRTQMWEAPGLGNRYDSISYDQNRRMESIQRAIGMARKQNLMSFDRTQNQKFLRWIAGMQ